MNLLHLLAVISSSNERKMPDSLSPSQIHILLGDGEAEKKPIRTRWQLFLPQMREKWPMPCPHPRSTFYSGMVRPRRNQLGMNSCLENLLPASIWPSLLARRLSSTDDSILGQIFRMKVKMLPPRRFPMHDGRTITALTQKNIPFKTEHKRQSVKIKNPRSSWTMALSRSIITQAIHHQPPIKAKYNNYFVLRGRAPPRYVSSVHVRTVSNFDGKFLLHRRRYTNAALKNAGKKLMCPPPLLLVYLLTNLKRWKRTLLLTTSRRLCWG